MPGHAGMILHLPKTGLRECQGDAIAWRTVRDIAATGTSSHSGGKQDNAQQRQTGHENHTNSPDVVERRHRFIVAGCGHASSSRSRNVTVKIG